jgi:hypothetical protein
LKSIDRHDRVKNAPSPTLRTTELVALLARGTVAIIADVGRVTPNLIHVPLETSKVTITTCPSLFPAVAFARRAIVALPLDELTKNKIKIS